MKIIDLLNKIANGEEVPKKIQYYDKYEEYSYTFTLEEDNNYYSKELGGWLFISYDIQKILNDELEILETTLNTKNMNITMPSKKIEKINLDFSGTCTSEELHRHTKILLSIRDLDEIFADKINEIIDKINGDKE